MQRWQYDAGSELLAKRSQPRFPMLRLPAMKHFRAAELGASTSTEDFAHRDSIVRRDEEIGL